MQLGGQCCELKATYRDEYHTGCVWTRRYGQTHLGELGDLLRHLLVDVLEGERGRHGGGEARRDQTVRVRFKAAWPL